MLTTSDDTKLKPGGPPSGNDMSEFGSKADGNTSSHLSFRLICKHKNKEPERLMGPEGRSHVELGGQCSECTPGLP